MGWEDDVKGRGAIQATYVNVIFLTVLKGGYGWEASPIASCIWMSVAGTKA